MGKRKLMGKRKKLFLYVFFAVIATAVNLLTQRYVFSINESNLGFFFALILGTILGLIVKYFLDKKWIFFDKGNGMKYQSRKFGIYTLMGIFSTIVFWSTETIFWIIWQKDNMREIGALIGLSMGYIIKYRLDKRFVFKKE